MWWRKSSVWAAGLALWGLALLLPGPSGHPPGQAAAWPPRSFAVYYGNWDHAKISQAHHYDLIIAHPGKQMERFNADLISRLRSGADGLPGNADDCLVLAYLSLGEDEDPAPGPGRPAARYLDRKKRLQKDGFFAMGEDGLPQEVEGADGIPDRNGAWGSYYVHPMDQEWREMLETRLQQLAERGVDGFFLDTVDVAPDLQEEMFELLGHLHARHPKLRWVANRGVDLWRKHPQEMRQLIDAVVLESWFTHWNWSWGRAVVAPDRLENERLSQTVLQGVTSLYLDYLDPQQPDRGSLLALRRGREPAFWSHPFLDRLQPWPETTPIPLAPVVVQLERLSDGRVQASAACEAWADSHLLPGARGPWAVGAATRLQVRQVDDQGNTSPPETLELAPRHDDWTAAWTVLELEHALKLSWEGGEQGQLWLGESPEGMKPTRVQGASPLRAEGLESDRLYWVALSRPGGAPDRARPARTQDVTPPPSPTRVAARRRGAYVTVTWEKVTAPDLAGYRVYLSRPEGPLALPFTRVGETNLEVRVDGPLEVLVTSFDGGNHESRPAPKISL
ncbi:MAG: endo alpha-1,4 polygalactosaminidase [Candidatus Eremiobacteraeota bacterium]|nr:endo alpha-1,4 polygalactosaminidase [Candidatus Eremiobacteraeota bacterium]MCW5868698.1 endo alpha-1,4 polygalactosaminidase [Candidatus Eremiobacteraeota bacterium]